jgi:hypothetical protein
MEKHLRVLGIDIAKQIFPDSPEFSGKSLTY